MDNNSHDHPAPNARENPDGDILQDISSGDHQQTSGKTEHGEITLGDIRNDLISEERQKELIKKFDSESSTRELQGIFQKVVAFLAIAMSAFHLYTSAFGLLDTMKHRAAHLAFILPLGYLMYNGRKKKRTNTPTVADCVLAVLSVVPALYIIVNYRDILMRGGMPNAVDMCMFVLCMLTILEAVRRVVGMQLMVVAIVFLSYAYLGPYLPGILAHKGTSLSRLTDHLFMIPEGIFSVALGTSSTFIVLFVIFSAFLERSGLSGLINDLCMALVGSSVGGPAKVSVATSALFGTISGSAAANVVTTGAFTIPLMKKTGYQKEFAGAVEAVASTGGQLMPPVMGSSAFIVRGQRI